MGHFTEASWRVFISTVIIVLDIPVYCTYFWDALLKLYCPCQSRLYKADYALSYLAFAATCLRVATLVYFVCIMPIEEACRWDPSLPGDLTACV